MAAVGAVLAEALRARLVFVCVPVSVSAFVMYCRLRLFFVPVSMR